MHANIFGCGKIRRRNTTDSTAPNIATNIHLPKRRKTLSDHQLLFATQRRHKFEIGNGGSGGEGEEQKRKKKGLVK